MEYLIKVILQIIKNVMVIIFTSIQYGKRPKNIKENLRSEDRESPED